METLNLAERTSLKYRILAEPPRPTLFRLLPRLTSDFSIPELQAKVYDHYYEEGYEIGMYMDENEKRPPLKPKSMTYEVYYQIPAEYLTVRTEPDGGLEMASKTVRADSRTARERGYNGTLAVGWSKDICAQAFNRPIRDEYSRLRARTTVLRLHGTNKGASQDLYNGFWERAPALFPAIGEVRFFYEAI